MEFVVHPMLLSRQSLGRYESTVTSSFLSHRITHPLLPFDRVLFPSRSDIEECTPSMELSQ